MTFCFVLFHICLLCFIMFLGVSFGFVFLFVVSFCVFGFHLVWGCQLEGTAREAATGRGAGLRFALKPALGQVASPLPRVSAVTCAWRAVAA